MRTLEHSSFKSHLSFFFPCTTSQVLLENHEGEAIRRRKEYLKGRGRGRKATTSAGRTEPGRWTSQSCQDLAHREVRQFGKAPCKRKKKQVLFPKQQVWLPCMAVHLFANFLFLTRVLILTFPFPTCPHALLSTEESQNLDGGAGTHPSGSFQSCLEISFRSSPVPVPGHPQNTPSPSRLIPQTDLLKMASESLASSQWEGWGPREPFLSCVDFLL